MGNGYLSRPVAALVFTPTLRDDLFPADVYARLTQVADLAPGQPLTTFTGRPARRRLASADVLLTGWGCPDLGTELLAAAPRLRAVIHAAGSVKHLVGPELFDRGVLVSSAAEANARPVAEFTVAVLVLALKRAVPLARALAAGQHRWERAPGEPYGLLGATVGVVGASRIGRQVVPLLRGHGARVLVFDPHRAEPEIRALGAEPAELDRLCATADAVSLHAPDLPETRHLIDEHRLALMRPGAVLVNTARGALVDTAALTRHCQAGRLDAVLDVTDPEPLPAGHPLLHLPNVLVTPHLAGARGRELRRLGEHAAAELERFAAGAPLHGLVELADLTTIA